MKLAGSTWSPPIIRRADAGGFPGGSARGAHTVDRTARVRDGRRAILIGAAGHADAQAGCPARSGLSWSGVGWFRWGRAGPGGRA